MIKTKKKNRQQQIAKKAKVQAPAPKSRTIVPVPTNRAPAVKLDFAADARMGQETMTQQDYSIPRLVILQALSPQVQDADAKHIDNAEAGDICDTVGQVLYDGENGILVTPISYRRSYIEWVPRTKGGGFVADHTPTNAVTEKNLQELLATCNRNDKGKIITPKGNNINVSGEYFIFLIDDSTGGYQPFVLTMSSTQAKKSRRWNTMISQFLIEYNGKKINPAMWYRTYRLTTIPERNDQGSWFGWQIMPEKDTVALTNGKEVYQDAKAFHASVKKGKVSVAAPEEEEMPGEAGIDDDVSL
jgi:hypothetical protein